MDPRLEYVEAASREWHMDVVHELPAALTAEEATAAWVEAQRRLNAITDPLARKLIALHRDCGSGSGECDGDDAPGSAVRGRDWSCETTRIIADHFDVEHP